MILGDDAPLEGQGFILPFLPKRIVGAIALAVASVFAASLFSPAATQLAEHIRSGLDLQERLGAVVAVPIFAVVSAVCAGHVWESLRDCEPVGAIGCCAFSAMCLLGLLVNLWHSA